MINTENYSQNPILAHVNEMERKDTSTLIGNFFVDFAVLSDIELQGNEILIFREYADGIYLDSEFFPSEDEAQQEFERVSRSWAEWKANK